MREMLQLDLRSGVLVFIVVVDNVVDNNFVNRNAGKASTSVRGSSEFPQGMRPGRDNVGACASEEKRALLLGVTLEHRHHEGETFECGKRNHCGELRRLERSGIFARFDNCFVVAWRLRRD